MVMSHREFFLGDVTALEDANTDKHGGFVGTSLYIATKGEITGVTSNLFKVCLLTLCYGA